jgi:hypothetical protein
MIIDRNIVVKREGNKLLLPTVQRKEVEVPTGAPNNTFTLCRIVSYDKNSGQMDLKLSSEFASDAHFRIAIEENSELLSALYINSVSFINFRSSFITSESQHTNTFNKKDLSYKASLSESESIAVKSREIQQRVMLKEKEVVNIQIGLSVDKLQFSDGKVCFEYYINQVFRKVSFEISNPFLKKEFDSVKNYFPKVLKISRFAITLQVEHLDGKILTAISTSNHISLINDSLFKLVEDLYISDHITNNGRDEIISLNEISLESAKNIGSENLKDADWLLNKLIAPGKTKHYYHLRYLSSQHLSNTFNLHLTGKPLSFIFLLPVSSGFCLIWETYATHEATYIWKLENSDTSELASLIQDIIECIKWLRKSNKTAFLKTKPENFIKIEHDYSGEDLGFKKWKTQLDEFIKNDHPF